MDDLRGALILQYSTARQKGQELLPQVEMSWVVARICRPCTSYKTFYLSRLSLVSRVCTNISMFSVVFPQARHEFMSGFLCRARDSVYASPKGPLFCGIWRS